MEDQTLQVPDAVSEKHDGDDVTGLTAASVASVFLYDGTTGLDWDGEIPRDVRKNLTKVEVEDIVTVLPNHTFNGCFKLKEIKIP